MWTDQSRFAWKAGIAAMTTWKEKMAADTARYEHLPNFITNVGRDRAPRQCCLCGRNLDDFQEGFATYEDGQVAHRLCDQSPHVYPRQRRRPSPESNQKGQSE